MPFTNNEIKGLGLYSFLLIVSAALLVCSFPLSRKSLNPKKSLPKITKYKGTSGRVLSRPFLSQIPPTNLKFMPMKSTAKKPRSNRPDQEHERRSKKRNEVPSSSAPPSHAINPSFAVKDVMRGRCVNFSFLSKEGFSLGEKLSALDLDTWCSLDLPTYPNLVKEFFMSAVHIKDGFKGFVCGVEVKITPDTVAETLDIPLTGAESYDTHPREMMITRLLGRPDRDTLNAQDLDVETRILLSIIHWILFPKTGSFNSVTERDLGVLYHIIEGIPLNFPKLVVQYIGETLYQGKAKLPYGMVFTKLFLDSGVKIPEDEIKERLKRVDYYSEGTLHRMFFVKIEGKWTKKAEPSSRPLDSSSEPSSPRSPPAPSRPASSHSASSSQSMPALSEEQLNMIASRVSDSLLPQLQSFGDRFSQLESRMDSIKADLLELKTRAATDQGTKDRDEDP